MILQQELLLKELFARRGVSHPDLAARIEQVLDVERARFHKTVDTAYTLIQYERNLAQA